MPRMPRGIQSIHRINKNKDKRWEVGFLHRLDGLFKAQPASRQHWCAQTSAPSAFSRLRNFIEKTQPASPHDHERRNTDTVDTTEEDEGGEFNTNLCYNLQYVWKRLWRNKSEDRRRQRRAEWEGNSGEPFAACPSKHALILQRNRRRGV